MGILLPVAIIILYGHLGYRLKKNYVLWGLMGLGIFMGPVLLVILVTLVFPNHVPLLSFWPMALLAGPLISLTIAGVIVYKNNDAFKRQNPAENPGSENRNS